MIYFISFSETGLKLNVTIDILSSNFRIQGLFLYFWIALIIGSAEFETPVCNSRFISKFKTGAVKNLFIISAHLEESDMISSSSIKVILLFTQLFCENNGLTCFQNFLLSCMHLTFKFS